MFNQVKAPNEKWKKWIGSLCFADDEKYTPLQAADVLSWVAGQLVRRSTRPPSIDRFTVEELNELLEIGTHAISRMSLLFQAPDMKEIDRCVVAGERILARVLDRTAEMMGN